MTSSRTPLDLLRETRLAQGLPDPSAAAAAQRGLLLKGTLIGAAVVAASAALTALLMVRQQMLSAELDRLALVEAEVQAADSRLASARTTLNSLTATNQTLRSGLVNARSGAALMSDLQRRVPAGVQLSLVAWEPGGNSLKLEGWAGNPLAFARINAFQIELNRSPLLEPNSAQLIKATRGEADSSTPSTQAGPTPPAQASKPRPQQPGLVSFELTARFRPTLAPAAELQLLNELGAGGMARRLQLLQSEGLAP
jgi:type IV pilus assembly protein PilN